MTLNQLPPLPVPTTGVKRIAELSLEEMVKICGNGFAPPNGITKFKGFACARTESPTATVILTVALMPVFDTRSNWPRKVPAN